MVKAYIITRRVVESVGKEFWMYEDKGVIAKTLLEACRVKEFWRLTGYAERLRDSQWSTHHDGWNVKRYRYIPHPLLQPIESEQ